MALDDLLDGQEVLSDPDRASLAAWAAGFLDAAPATRGTMPDRRQRAGGLGQLIKAIPPVLAHTANGPFNSPDHLFEIRMLELLDGLNGNGVIDSPAVEGCGQEMIKLVKARCLEGVMAKRMDGRYLPGRRAPVHSCPNITANAGRSAAKVSNSLSSVEFGESVALGGVLGGGGSDATLLAMVDRLYHVELSIHEVRPPQLPVGLDDRPDLLLLQHTARSVRQNRAAAEPNKLLSVLVR